MKSSRKRARWALVVLAALGLSAAAAEQNQTPRPRPSHFKWEVDKGSPDGSNYSALSQINRSNVSQMQVAWSFSTGDSVEYTFNPIVVDRVMYVLAHNNAVTAIDAGTGVELWSVPPPAGGGGSRRGINYWSSPDGSDRRLLASWGNYLYALNARDGQIIPTFGSGGRVNLKEGLGRDASLITNAQSASAGRVFENLIILGSTTGEQYVSASPGDIRAYDVRSGQLVWTFHTIPRPGEFGYETWPKDAWQYTGGANNWGDMALDEARGIVYIPTGSPTYDFYGGDRKGNNLFGNCLLALDARTGKRLWHYQIIHHDIWDYDQVSSPQLVTVRQGGRNIDVVATAGKNGLLFVFDRVTGAPIWPIEERPVPKSDVPGEWASPTQPFPTKPEPFHAITPLDPNNVNPYVISDEERARFRELITNARNEGLYTPPSVTKFAVEQPGHSGGSNLFSTSADPTSGMVYVLSYGGPHVLKLETSQAATANNNTWGPRSSESVVGAPGAGRGGRGGGAGRGGANSSVVAALVQQGQSVFAANCQVCHGSPVTGGGTVGVALVGVTARLSDEAITDIVTKGQGRMPSFSTLADQDLNALLAYLKNPSTVPQRGGGGGRAEAAYPIGVEGPAAQRYYSGYGFAPLMMAPPWSTYTAYDLNTGTIKWQIPVGDAIGPGLEPGNNFGDAMVHGPKSTLTITAGGLAFAGTRDRKFRAYDKDTGKVLWSAELPDMSQGVPTVYELDGRQYVVVQSVGSWIAYALPPKP